jgi:uncharacterized peroxidase-related enzyme
MHDYRNADLDAETRAMLDYAYKLTKTPTDVHHEDFMKLKDIGLSHQQILSVVMIICTFNFMTRLADGLGVEPREETAKAVLEWLTDPAREQKWLVEPKT